MTDKYTGPDVRPGDRVKFIDVDGSQFDDVIHSVRYRSSQPEIRKQPTGWRKAIRRLTPPRFRKPLPVLRPAEPSGVELVYKSDVAHRAQLMLTAAISENPEAREPTMSSDQPCRDCGCPETRCTGYGYGRKCCPDCKHVNPI